MGKVLFDILPIINNGFTYIIFLNYNEKYFILQNILLKLMRLSLA